MTRKFFLNVSKAEQKRRFLSRLDDPSKNWKFSTVDVEERSHWGEYMEAYEQMIRGTSTRHAPWCVVPADHKWLARLVISAVIIQTLKSLDSQFPTVDDAKRGELAAVRKALAG